MNQKWLENGITFILLAAFTLLLVGTLILPALLAVVCHAIRWLVCYPILLTGIILLGVSSKE